MIRRVRREMPPFDERPSLPTMLVIGAMKCGTSALHEMLDQHPEVCMAPGKELNFFIGAEEPPAIDPEEWWRHGQWHRGLDWYRRQFDGSAPVRGESSPGYTDPAHPMTAQRIHDVVPRARLVYLVREPLERAVSQWSHHVRDGTEARPLEEALLDPDSQYVARSRYFERITPFLDLFPAEQLLVVVQERLRDHPDRTLRRVLEHIGADPDRWPSPETSARSGRTGTKQVSSDLAREFAGQVADDVAALREWLGDEIVEWEPRPGSEALSRDV